MAYSKTSKSQNCPFIPDIRHSSIDTKSFVVLKKTRNDCQKVVVNRESLKRLLVKRQKTKNFSTSNMQHDRP